MSVIYQITNHHLFLSQMIEIKEKKINHHIHLEVLGDVSTIIITTTIQIKF